MHGHHPHQVESRFRHARQENDRSVEFDLASGRLHGDLQRVDAALSVTRTERGGEGSEIALDRDRRGASGIDRLIGLLRRQGEGLAGGIPVE